MNLDNLLLNTTCRIICGDKKGTGFFISPNLILTARHVIYERILDVKEDILITNCDEEKLEYIAQLQDECELCDIALINLNNGSVNQNFLSICCSDLVKDECFVTYGYPDTFDGNLVGVPLGGNVLRVISNSVETIHDVSLEITKPNHQITNEGFSGAPLLNAQGEVISVMRYDNDGYLSAVSIKKAKEFLTKHEINLNTDFLHSFKHYKKEVFDCFPENIKSDCEFIADPIFREQSPNDVLKNLKDTIFYPKSEELLDVIIAKLKNNNQLNTCLWDGWIHLLTYVKILKGDLSEINNIQFILHDVELASMLGENTKFETLGSIPIVLNFYFTEENSYFQLARKNIREISNNKVNTCSIFNADNSRFDLKKFTLKDKRKILPDITNPEKSSFSVNRRIYLGVLSLRQLSEEIAKSESLEEATVNLEKIFKDAIT